MGIALALVQAQVRGDGEAGIFFSLRGSSHGHLNNWLYLLTSNMNKHEVSTGEWTKIEVMKDI